MKAQILWIVLLFSVSTTSVLAQEHSQSNKPELQEHPLMKYYTILEKSQGHHNAFKIANDSYQLNSVEQQAWSGESWISYQKREKTYQSGKRVESRGYSISEAGSGWVLNKIDNYTYENGLLTLSIFQEIFENEPVYQERTLITYQTSAGMTLPISTIFQYWDETEEDWSNEDRTNIQVENGVIVGGSYDEWINDEWVETDQFTFEEVDGDLVETTIVYDFEIEEWINYQQIVYSNITADDLFDEFNQSIDQIDDGTLFLSFTILPDYTSYEWMETGESGIWVATERQVTTSSTELEYGAETALMTSIEYISGESEEWIPAFEVLVGYNENNRPAGLSFYLDADESESVDLQKVYSESYQYSSNDLLEMVLKFGSLDIIDSFKITSDDQAIARTLLSWSDVTTSINLEEQPLGFRLNAAYPNPFNPSTVIPFQMATASDVNIQVFDMLGRNVATLVDEFRPAGEHTVRFDGSGLSSGVYMIKMVSPGLQQTRSVTLLK